MPVKRPTKYVEEPSPLLCPVCKNIFEEPIISVKCGHTFCRQCIERLVSAGERCPLDGNACGSGQLVLNLAIIGQLADLKVYCCHGILPPDSTHNTTDSNDSPTYKRDPDGCPMEISIGKRSEHEDSCQFAWTECPIGGSPCGPLRKKDLEEHMEHCVRVPCTYADLGCVFTGDRTKMNEHKSSCMFKDEAQLMAAVMKELKAVKGSNEEFRKLLSQANKTIEKLVVERVTMVSQLEQQALTITSLSSRMDKLETEMEAQRVPRRYSSSHHSKGGETTPRYSRREKHGVNDVYKRWSTESASSVTSYTSYLETMPSRNGQFHWQMPFTVKCIGTFRGHKGTIWSLVASGGHLYSGSSDGSIKVWDVQDFRKGCLKTAIAHKDCTLCMTANKEILFSAGTDLYVRSWHMDTLEEIGSIQNAHDSMVSAMASCREYLFTSSFACIKIWDAVTLREVHKMDTIPQSWVRSLTYNKRKNMLYSCSSNKIYVWKCYDDFSLVHDLETQHGALYSIATTKKHIITGTHSQNIQVYDIVTLQHLHTLSGHIGRVTVLCVVESTHGDYMFSGSSDSTVTVWNLENMLPILTLQRHEKAVHSLAVWNDSVFSGSEDMEIKVFRHFKL